MLEAPPGSTKRNKSLFAIVILIPNNKYKRKTHKLRLNKYRNNVPLFLETWDQRKGIKDQKNYQLHWRTYEIN